MYRLDPTNPQPIDVAEETLNIRHSVFSTEDSLLMSAFSLLIAPAYLTIHLHCSQDAPLPPDLTIRFLSSVDILAPFIYGASSPILDESRIYSGELLRTL